MQHQLSLSSLNAKPPAVPCVKRRSQPALPPMDCPCVLASRAHPRYVAFPPPLRAPAHYATIRCGTNILLAGHSTPLTNLAPHYPSPLKLKACAMVLDTCTTITPRRNFRIRFSAPRSISASRTHESLRPSQAHPTLRPRAGNSPGFRPPRKACSWMLDRTRRRDRDEKAEENGKKFRRQRGVAGCAFAPLLTRRQLLRLLASRAAVRQGADRPS